MEIYAPYAKSTRNNIKSKDSRKFVTLKIWLQLRIFKLPSYNLDNHIGDLIMKIIKYSYV